MFTPVLLALRPRSGPAGATVTVTGSGLFAGETATLFFDGGTIGHAKTTQAGSFTATVTIPTATAGAHVIAVRGNRSGGEATATFTVTG